MTRFWSMFTPSLTEKVRPAMPTVCGGCDCSEPDLLAKRDERWGPEGKERTHQIDHRVVVQEAVARLDRKQLADGELPDAGASKQEDYLCAHGA